MTTSTSTSTTLRGVHIDDQARVTLSTPASDYLESLDAALRDAAEVMGAVSVHLPGMLDADDLARTGYFDDFVHLACLGVEPGVAGPVAQGGSVDSGSRVRGVLPSAACYGVYPVLKDSTMPEAQLFTVRSTCFRNEQRYEPLRRQWSFTMREIVFAGSGSSAADFFEDVAARAAESLADRLGVPARWQPAVDPFYGGDANPKTLLQRIHPVKFELVDETGLALASRNRHFDHFTKAFGIGITGNDAATACLAFGWERWLDALGRRHGPDASRWPQP